MVMSSAEKYEREAMDRMGVVRNSIGFRPLCVHHVRRAQSMDKSMSERSSSAAGWTRGKRGIMLSSHVHVLCHGHKCRP